MNDAQMPVKKERNKLVSKYLIGLSARCVNSLNIKKKYDRNENKLDIDVNDCPKMYSNGMYAMP